MNVLILAGGRGTRLQSVVSDRPKSLADISGKPFLHYQLNYLRSQGVSSVYLSIGHMAEKIIAALGTNYLGLTINYVIEESPLGTGGAINFVEKNIKDSDKMLVLNGDTYFPVNLKKFHDFHCSMNLDISVALAHVDDCTRYGRVIQSGKIVESFSEKSIGGPGWINGGMYLLNSSVFKALNNFDNKPFSFETDILSKKKEINLTIAGYNSDADFIDIGTPESFESAQNFIKI